MDDNQKKKIQESDSWRFALELLYNAHVVVVPGLAFGPAGENHVRMSFGRSRNDIKEGMERIMKYLSKN